MSNEIINKLIITDVDGTQLKVETRQVENVSCLVLDINGSSIFLDEESDIIALLRYADTCIGTQKKTSLIR